MKSKLCVVPAAAVWTITATCLSLLLIQGTLSLPADDERYVDREIVYSSPGIHELATNLLAQLRQSSASGNSLQLGSRVANGCGYQSTVGKRNSELINSLLGLPKQVSNGRK